MIIDDLFVVLINQGAEGARPRYCLRATVILDGVRHGNLIPVQSLEPRDVLKGLDMLAASLRRRVEENAAGE